MRMTKTLLAGLLMAGTTLAPTLAYTQTASPSISGPTNAGDESGMTNDQLITQTVHEAWVASGRNEDKFFAMVKQLAEFSAQKRNITLPQTQQAGEKAGEWIKKEARKDPNQLLYVVVDRAVRHVTKALGAQTADTTK